MAQGIYKLIRWQFGFGITKFVDVIQSVSSLLSRQLSVVTIGNAASFKYNWLMITLFDLLTSVGETPWLLNTSIGNKTYGWGEGCFYTPNRGGICYFRQKHFFALQAFAEYSISFIGKTNFIKDDIPTSTVFADINSEKDGGVSDSIASATVRSLKSRGLKASKCNFGIKSHCPLSEVTHANKYLFLTQSLRRAPFPLL